MKESNEYSIAGNIRSWSVSRKNAVCVHAFSRLFVFPTPLDGNHRTNVTVHRQKWSRRKNKLHCLVRRISRAASKLIRYSMCWVPRNHQKKPNHLKFFFNRPSKWTQLILLIGVGKNVQHIYVLLFWKIFSYLPKSPKENNSNTIVQVVIIHDTSIRREPSTHLSPKIFHQTWR